VDAESEYEDAKRKEDEIGDGSLVRRLDLDESFGREERGGSAKRMTPKSAFRGGA